MNQVHTTDNQLHDLIQVSPEESRPYDGWAGFPGCGDGQLGVDYNTAYDKADELNAAMTA